MAEECANSFHERRGRTQSNCLSCGSDHKATLPVEPKPKNRRWLCAIECLNDYWDGYEPFVEVQADTIEEAIRLVGEAVTAREAVAERRRIVKLEAA